MLQKPSLDVDDCMFSLSGGMTVPYEHPDHHSVKEQTKQKLIHPFHRTCEQPVINSVDSLFCNASTMNEMQIAQYLSIHIINISIS